jgi:hypothetical protein
MTVPGPRQKRQHALDSSVGLLGPGDQPSGHVLAVQDDDGTPSLQIMPDDWWLQRRSSSLIARRLQDNALCDQSRVTHIL